MNTDLEEYFSNLLDRGKKKPAQNSVILGHDVDTGEPIYLGDIERRSTMYILGKSGMGKTELMINMILRDIMHRHGVFFLDPHGDAVEKIISRMPPERIDDVILLDPTDKTHTFGINLLSCKDASDIEERNDAYNRAKGAFERIERIWREDVRLWLQLISSHTLEVFIENQGYTLAEVPLFLDLENPAFRNQLVSKVRHGIASAYYWQNTFPAQNKKDREAKIDPLLTRLSILLAHEYVRHIIGQINSTIDFPTIMQERKIVLLKLPASLAEDVKRFLGTILISELLHAARNRPEDKRHQFCIFVDEFQNFATAKDFDVFINEARKFGISTTVAHQERYGQFADNKEILGATDAAANKVFFQLTVRDSQEQAPEFAKKPPTEVKRESVLVITQDPFPTLLRGHDNPQIREFSRRYLRPLQYRLEDLKDEMEEERLLRQYFVDQAALYRVYERIAAWKERYSYDPGKYIDAQYNALAVQLDALWGAIDQSEKLMSMHRGYTQLRLRLRSLNDFFTSLMEGRIKPGHEEFSLFIASFVCASSFSRVPFKYVKLLTLYVCLKYGDPGAKRAIPFLLAQAHGIFQNTVSLLTHQAMEKTRKARQEFQESYIKKEWESYRLNKEWKAESIERELTEIRAKILENFRYHSCYAERNEYDRLLEECEKVDVATLEHRGGGSNHLVIMNILPKPGSLQNRELADRYFKQGCEPVQRVIWLPENIYTLYVWLLAYPDLWNLIAPYSTAQFDNGWKALLTNMGFASNIDKMILQIGWAFTQDFAYYELAEGKLGGYHYLPCKCSDCKEYNWYVKRSNDFHYLEFLKDSIVRKLERFLQEYKEGAFVMLALLDAAHHGWRGDIGLPALPGIAGKHPIEVLRLIKKLNDIMRLNSNFEVFLIYFDRARRLNFFKKVIYRPDIYLNQSKDYKDDFLEELRGYGGFDLAAGELGMPYDTRKGVRFLKTTLTDRWDWFSRNYPEAARQWVSTDEIERWYSLNRAWEIVFYSETIAYTDTSLVSALVHLLKDTEARLVEAKQREKDEKLKKEEAEKRKEIERKCAEKMANISIAPLENLAPVVLSESEIKALREACLKELYQTNQRDWDVKTTLEVIDEFVKFCILLMKPENHVKVQSGQYVEKQVNTRQYHDMNDEMAWELMKLPRFTAYAKVIQEQQGEQVIRIRKIKTLKLEEPRLQGRELEEMKKQINENTKILGYIKPRVQIEDEIRQRQEKWRSGALSDKPPPTYY